MCLSGARGSYSDMGGPVITTQVTIPKDVGIYPLMTFHLFYITVQALACGVCTHTNLCLAVSSWLDPSLEREARGLSRSAENLERQSKLTTHSRALKIASSPSLAHRTRFRTHSTCYKTGRFYNTTREKYLL